MLFTDLINLQHAYIILCNRHDDPHQEQDAEVDEDGVRGQKKICAWSLTHLIQHILILLRLLQK